ncbi:MAG: hypothetical protein ABI407_01915 [Bradyrhizobium sp.]
MTWKFPAANISAVLLAATAVGVVTVRVPGALPAIAAAPLLAALGGVASL